jgi:hypothetical protein
MPALLLPAGVQPGGKSLLHPPYDFIAEGLKRGEVVPFFGAAASAVYRPPNEPWNAGKPFMPFGDELARTLAKAAQYPADEAYKGAIASLSQALEQVAWRCEEDRRLIKSELSRAGEEQPNDPAAEQGSCPLAPALLAQFGVTPDLALVASWAEHQGHRRAVDRKLHESFAVDCTPGLLHEKLAGIEATRLYVTTNYDDLLEKALAPRQPHVIIDRGDKGLRVFAAGTTPTPVSSTGDELYDLLNDRNTQQPSRPVIFKMHGSVDKADASNDCYLITEGDYVDFLGRAAGKYIPPYITALMQGKDFLFLGYSLVDWNVRVILRKLLTRPVAGPVKFWAIVSGHSEVEQRLWQAQNLNIYPMDLLAFAKELAKYL